MTTQPPTIVSSLLAKLVLSPYHSSMNLLQINGASSGHGAMIPAINGIIPPRLQKIQE
jgi:hypothetical protein